MSRKIGFWSVFALVTGSQIGSGVFMLPASLAPYGLFSLGGWLISGVGAIALALVFARLCSWFAKTGGPHVYINQAFGPSAAFFTGWTYWVISWVSTTVVIVASVGYLTPLIGCTSPTVNVVLEAALLLAVTTLNMRGVSTAGRAEFVLAILKVIPLLVVPVLALCAFNSHNFVIDASVASLTTGQLLGRVTLLTLWGFIGLEAATTPAESVENPSKTIPRAVVAGTICVAVMYLLNSLGIMGAIPGSALMNANAPYAEAARVVFGGNWHVIISIIAAIVCIGTLNAWTLTSGQIALGLAHDGLMPACFGHTNKHGAPTWGLVMSSLGILPLLVMTASKGLAAQVLTIIDFSVTAFLFVYAACCLAFFRLLLQRKERLAAKIVPLMYGAVALAFCCWVIYETPLYTIGVASLFTVVGIPLYAYLRSRAA
jgi:APA family basic amino acid/polyamine antiporter